MHVLKDVLQTVLVNVINTVIKDVKSHVEVVVLTLLMVVILVVHHCHVLVDVIRAALMDAMVGVMEQLKVEDTK